MVALVLEDMADKPRAVIGNRLSVFAERFDCRFFVAQNGAVLSAHRQAPFRHLNFFARQPGNFWVDEHAIGKWGRRNLFDKMVWVRRSRPQDLFAGGGWLWVQKPS